MHRGVKLYRAILQSHRANLPAQLQKLGNEYVKSEFRLHKKVEKQDVLAKFYAGWEEYLGTIKSQKGKFGKEMSPGHVESLSEAQRQKLLELKEEARKASSV